MTTTTTRNIALMGLAVGLMAAVGCLGTGESSCDPLLDEACACETIAGDVCDDPADLDCVCFYEDERESLGLDPREDDEPEPFRFVLIEDSTNPVSGEAPGADIDAVSVIKADGLEFFATTVEDSHVGGARNNYADVNEMLGAPDSECEKKNFVSLGGADFGGYAVLGFASINNGDVQIENGDAIQVYELGGTMCPGSNFDNDPYTVSVSVTDELGTFIEVGEGGDGRNLIPITGL